MDTDNGTGEVNGVKPAVGFGPNRGGSFSQEDYHHPAAGWGAAISVSNVLIKQGELIDGTRAVFRMNHENGGYDCPGCAWPDDRKGLTMDICENGIKHAALPRGCAMGYMPELNVLCPIGDYSSQSDQPLMKHVLVEIRSSAGQLEELNTGSARLSAS
jgi:hypothetical protein